MDHRHRYIEVLKVFASRRDESGQSRAPQYLDLHKRHRDLDAVDERAEALTGILEGESWAVFKTLMAGEQRSREKAAGVGSLATIDSDIQRFLSYQGKMPWFRRR